MSAFSHKRKLAPPKEVEHWSMTTMREKLIKIGAKVVRHGRYVTFQLAEVAIPRTLFADILRRIDPINRIQTVALNVLVRKRLRCSWLRPTFATAAEMLSLTEYMRSRVGEDRLVLCMMFHSNEATAGMSPYHATAEEVDDFLARLSGYLEAVFSRFEVKPVGLSDLAAVQ